MLLFHITDSETFEETFKKGKYTPKDYKNTKLIKFFPANEMPKIIKNEVNENNYEDKIIIIISTKSFKFHEIKKSGNTYILEKKLREDKIHDILMFEKENDVIKLISPSGKLFDINKYFEQ